MSVEEFSHWGFVFALSAAITILSFGIILFHSLLNDRKTGVVIIIAFILAGIGRAAQFYYISAAGVLIMLPMIIYFCFKHWKEKIIWVNAIVFALFLPLTGYVYWLLYQH